MTEMTKQQRLRLKQRVVGTKSHETILADTHEALAEFMEHFTPDRLPAEQAIRLRAMLELALREQGVSGAQALAIEDEFLTKKYPSDERD